MRTIQAVAPLLALSVGLSGCISSGRSDPMTTPPPPAVTGGDTRLPKRETGGLSVPLDENASPLDLFAHGAPPAQPQSPQEQQQADELVTAWFQESVHDKYSVVDRRIIIPVGIEPWYYFNGHTLKPQAGAMGATEDSFVPLPDLRPFAPPRDLGWGTQDSTQSGLQSTAWRVARPHEGVVAAVLLSDVLPGKRSILAYFELKPVSGRS